MQKKYKVFLVIVAILIIILCVFAGSYVFRKKQVNNDLEIISTIDGYNYTLSDQDTELMKTTFDDLKDVLSKKPIDFDSYAKDLSKLFVIDLFTMSNKYNKYDIGGLEYVLDSEKEKFSAMVIDTLYDQLKDNLDGKRNQQLPTVKAIEITDFEETTYKHEEESYPAYNITLSWEYVNDYGYDKEATITAIKDDEIIYIVEYQPIVSEEVNK